jgi:hypothetical protein
MAGFSDTLENAILDHVFGGGDYTRAATLYVALYSAAPTDAGGGTELSGNGYARVAVTNNSTNFPGASGGAKANGTVISFPAATGAWSEATHFGILTASSGGTLVCWGALAASKTAATSDVLRIPVGDLDITLD